MVYLPTSLGDFVQVNVGNIPAPWSIWDRIECVYSIECCSLPDDSHMWVSKVMGGPQARWMVYFMENPIEMVGL